MMLQHALILSHRLCQINYHNFNPEDGSVYVYEPWPNKYKLKPIDIPTFSNGIHELIRVVTGKAFTKTTKQSVTFVGKRFNFTIITNCRIIIKTRHDCLLRLYTMKNRRSSLTLNNSFVTCRRHINFIVLNAFLLFR